MALTKIQLKICRFHGSLSQKGSQPLLQTIIISNNLVNPVHHSNKCTVFSTVLAADSAHYAHETTEFLNGKYSNTTYISEI